MSLRLGARIALAVAIAVAAAAAARAQGPSPQVLALQWALRLAGFALVPDGWFGPQTISALVAFQRRAGLTPDGIDGPATELRLAWAVAPRRTLAPGDRGPAVALLQARLAALGFSPGPVDGIYGPATAAALRAFQEAVGAAPDGVAGPGTLRALFLPPAVVQPGDTLWSIAQAYALPVSRLLAANPGLVAGDLQLGTKVQLPGPVLPARPVPAAARALRRRVGLAFLGAPPRLADLVDYGLRGATFFVPAATPRLTLLALLAAGDEVGALVAGPHPLADARRLDALVRSLGAGPVRLVAGDVSRRQAKALLSAGFALLEGVRPLSAADLARPPRPPVSSLLVLPAQEEVLVRTPSYLAALRAQGIRPVPLAALWTGG